MKYRTIPLRWMTDIGTYVQTINVSVKLTEDHFELEGNLICVDRHNKEYRIKLQTVGGATLLQTGGQQGEHLKMTVQQHKQGNEWRKHLYQILLGLIKRTFNYIDLYKQPNK